ncbi:ATP-binding protein [Halobacterium yunchengense]|uniref:ATP-binding protein n=1 Tax=Halobacterium yunchengense TaxID=3108497 RepID=UPI003008C627
MPAVDTALSVAVGVVAVSLLSWTSWTALRAREEHSALSFTAVTATLAVWSIASLGRAGFGAESLLPFAELGAALFVPGAWTLYVLSYTGRGAGLTRLRIAMLAGIVLPVLVIGGVIARGSSESTVEIVTAAMSGLELLYLLVLSVYATYHLGRLGRNHDRITTQHVVVMVSAVSAPYVLGVAWPAGIPPGGVPIGLAVSGCLLTVAVRAYPVLTAFPRTTYVARSRVVESLREAVVVLDRDDYILDANRTAGDLFGESPGELIGRPIRAVGDDFETTSFEIGVTEVIPLRSTAGRRQFQYSVSAIDDTSRASPGTGRPVAKAVLFRDVTDQRSREQRLSVLHRVLRHNVRNKLDVVLAYADQVEDPEVRAGIRDSANRLVTLSTKAREAEALMSTTGEQSRDVNLAAVARSVADEYRAEYPGSDLVVDAPDECVVSSHESLLRGVVSELVDNALEHGADSSPRVVLRVRKADAGAVEISVADDGPGIPERERRMLAEGVEAQLEHGQGIGLWLVNWAVLQLGGELRFRENEPTGSVVTVRLYDERDRS